jgi:hypothetical protein
VLSPFLAGVYLAGVNDALVRPEWLSFHGLHCSFFSPSCSISSSAVPVMSTRLDRLKAERFFAGESKLVGGSRYGMD